MRKSVSLVLILWAAASAAAGQDLLTAVRTGDLAGVRRFVDPSPGIVNVPNADGDTILFAAIAARRPDIVAYFISKGADVNFASGGRLTPLQAACRRGAPLEIIKLLVEAGAEVNAVAKYQGRPLDAAYGNDLKDVAAYLVSKGAVATPLEFETVKLADGLHRLAYPWGMRNNLTVSTGGDGALVVDTGFSARAVDEVRKIVAGFGTADIQWVLNTHGDWDHVAGNALAPNAAAVIGAETLDELVRQGRLARSARGPVGPGGAALPAPYILRFNGEEIGIIPYPELHTGGDVMIHFPKAGVLCLGDLLLSQSCPAVRDADAYLEFLDKILDVFPDGTTFVSGHGRDLNRAGLKRYRDDMAAMAALVRKALTPGRTAEGLIREDVLKAYKPAYSHLDWLGPDSWIRTVVRGLRRGNGR